MNLDWGSPGEYSLIYKCGDGPNIDSYSMAKPFHRQYLRPEKKAVLAPLDSKQLRVGQALSSQQAAG